MKVTAKASVLSRFSEPLEMVEFPCPTPAPGAAVVRTEMAGICGTDVHLWKGELPIQLPVVLGHETVGRLDDIGSGLVSDWTGQTLNLGDRVVWNSATSCGECFYCLQKNQPTRCPQRRAYGIGHRCDQPPHFLGGYAQLHYLNPRTSIFKIPGDLPTESVIGAGCALITAIHGVERICGESRWQENSSCTSADRLGMPIFHEPWRDWVVVQGSGPVGIAALAVAKNAVASNVIVIGGPKHRLDMAKRFGASHVVDLEELPRPEDRIDAVRRLTGGYGADVVLECVGQPGAVNEGMEMCRDGAKYLILGHYCNAGSVQWNPHTVTRKQLQVFGSWSSEPRHLRTALEFLRLNRQHFPFDAMVTDRFPLDQAHEALRHTASWQSAKSVIVP